MTASAALQRQVNRLRFDDPAQELRFRTHEDEHSIRQWRLVTGFGALLVAAIGVFYGSSRGPSAEVENFGRFALVLPCFVVPLALSFWPAARPRLQLVGALCGGGALTLHFLTECFSMSAGGRLTSSLSVSLFALATQFLVALAVALPLCTTALAAAILPSVALSYFSITAAFPEALARPALHRIVIELTATNFGIACILLGVAWARERLRRQSFAQQEELAAINGQLARLNAEQNEFMAIAAHDLRSPLATIGGVAEQLARQPAPEKLAPGLQLIAGQAGRMLALVNDCLGAHAAESGALPVRRARVELGAAARDAVTRHSTAASAKSQTLQLAGADAGIAVETDPALLAQILDNFVSNAVKFSPATATVRLEIQSAPGVPRVRLAVIDSGPGIPVEEQALLFRKFARTSVRPTAGEASHGLGLAVAKRLAESIGGRVGCDSAPGRGSAFWVELPLAA